MRKGIFHAAVPVVFVLTAGCASQKPASAPEQKYSQAYVQAISAVSQPDLLTQSYTDYCTGIAKNEEQKAEIQNAHDEWLQRNQTVLQEIQPYLDAASFYKRESLLSIMADRMEMNSSKASPEQRQQVCASHISKIKDPSQDIANETENALAYLRSGLHGQHIDYPHDLTLAGSWSGKRENVGECDNLYWDLERTADGEYQATFYESAARNNTIAEVTGDWWISGNRYFERTSSGAVDIYVYNASENNVHYEMIKAGVGSDCDIPNYTFTDSRR